LGTVRLEVYPWVSELLGGGRADRLLLEEEVHAGDTVRHLLHRLAARYPDFARRAFDPASGQLSSLVSLFHNDRFLELVEGLDTALAPGDSLTMLPAWEGGTARQARCGQHPETVRR